MLFWSKGGCGIPARVPCRARARQLEVKFARIDYVYVRGSWRFCLKARPKNRVDSGAASLGGMRSFMLVNFSQGALENLLKAPFEGETIILRLTDFLMTARSQRCKMVRRSIPSPKFRVLGLGVVGQCNLDAVAAHGSVISLRHRHRPFGAMTAVFD